jgi:transposase, IS5 family
MPFTTGGDPRSFHREAGEPVKEGARETRRLARRLRQRARGRGAQVKLAAARRLDELADRVGKIARQMQRRLAGEKISGRPVSMFDPDARPIRKGKLRAPTEFGHVSLFAELTENTRRGARGLLLPAAAQLGMRPRTRC